MLANIEDKVMEKLRVLPESQQAEVLKFVEELAEVKAKPGNGQAGAHVPMWDKIQAIMHDVPDEVLADIPTDGSVNVDHYLNGTRKK